MGCAWCQGAIPSEARRDSIFCSKRCRQASFRFRGRRVELEARELRAVQPLRMAYADPPYPGLARRYYAGEPSFAGEVNHVELLAELAGFDGWALSTGEFALRDLLPLCPHGARVCPWVKPVCANPRTFGLHGAWEAVIVVPGRRLRPGKRDWLLAAPARLGGSRLKGRKPLAFVAWLFELLGLLPGDELVDLYPGSGVVGAAWREAQRVARPRGTTCRAAARRDPSAEVLGDASRPRGGRRVAAGDAPESRHGEALGDASTNRRAPASGDPSRVGRRRRVPLGAASARPPE